jgi:hypothetical protein
MTVDERSGLGGLLRVVAVRHRQHVEGGFCDAQDGLTDDGIVCCLSGLS